MGGAYGLSKRPYQPAPGQTVGAGDRERGFSLLSEHTRLVIKANASMQNAL